MPTTEILAIGSELLLGVTVDTNSTYLAHHLTTMGMELTRHVVVDDDRANIVAALNDALNRADFVLCTGGLGPTLDDLTREAVAQALDRPLEFRQELLDQIAARFAAMRRTMSESNRVQAYVPQGARHLANPHGTAPAFLVEDPRGTIIVLPGVPIEMRGIFEQQVVPYLREERGIRTVILVRTFHVAGLGESVIGERIADLMKLANPTVGTSAKQGRCEVRVTTRAESQSAAEALLNPIITGMHERLGEHLVGEESPAEQVTRLLREQGYTLALFENTPSAPCYHALHNVPDGMQQVRGVMLAPEMNELPVDEHADILALARAGAESVQTRWQSDLALGIQIATTADDGGMTQIGVVLLTPQGVQETSRHFDLQQKEFWEYVGNLALEVLRKYLLH
jgi:competence/damage-inducible protein CinA-like protein